MANVSMKSQESRQNAEFSNGFHTVPNPRNRTPEKGGLGGKGSRLENKINSEQLDLKCIHERAKKNNNN